MRGLFCITIYSIIYLSACNYNVVKDPQALNGGNSSQSQPVNESAVVSWTLIKTSVLSSCMDCHVGHTPPELGSLASAQQSLDKILVKVNANEMPPTKNGYSTLSDCRKAILQTWVQQGGPDSTQTRVGDLLACKASPAPGDGGPQGEETPLEQLPLNYNTLLTKVLQPKCIKCHNPDSEDVDAAGILFFPYSEIGKRKNLWAGPGRSSKIVRVLARDDEERMPPPEDSGPLSTQELDFISRWIDAGRPEK